MDNWGMGRISDRYLRRLPREKARGRMVKIGSQAAEREATATVVEKVGGVWRYGKEVGIRVWMNSLLELAVNDGSRLVWRGLEIQLALDSETKRWKHADLTAGLFPLSQDWRLSAKLRPARNRSVGQKMKLVEAALRTQNGAVEKALLDLRFDVFETSNKWLTARLADPLRMRWDAVIGLGEQFARTRGTNYRSEKKAYWHFGLCGDAARAKDEVLREFGEARLYERLESTWRRKTGYPSMTNEMAWPVLGQAVEAALAGVDGGDRRGRVAERALRLFHEVMEAGAKREERRGG
jgi:hypothetical protein